MPTLDDESLLGRRLDQRYLIHELIARGGMASVFRATDERLDRTVAVKVMHPGDQEVSTPAAFSQEAKFAARINHRGIVAVYDQGTDGELVYLVMEHVEGRTLRDVIRDDAPMSPKRALAWLEPVLVALDAAHRAGVVHRDMKPENVLISTGGEVKVTDFGLARTTTVDHETAKVLVGTVSYLAPEVISNDTVDARADVYACGAILFEMLTGRKPHEAQTPIAVAHKHVTTDIDAPSTVVPGIPDYVDALVRRATARDRGQRSPDARTLLHQVRLVQQALQSGLAGDPELTADLLPGAGPTPARTPVFPGVTDDGPRTPASTPSRPDDSTATTVIGTVGSVSDHEPTRTWAVPEASDGGSGEQPHRRRGKALAVFALASLLLAGVLGWWLALGRWDQTPNLVNETRDEAVKIAEAAGFGVDFTADAWSETVKKGSVISTSPAAGERILPGKTVTLTISKGKERYKIPDLKGKTLDEAETILGSLNLQVGNTVQDWHDDIPDGQIIRSSSHDVGQKVKRDTAVDLVVSKGPEPVDLVDFTGKKAETAVRELTALGLEPKVEEVFHDTVKAGDVISQTPKSGTGHRGDTIELKVSKGPELFTVPDLDGMTAKEAEAALAGLNLRLNPTFNPIVNKDKATVRYQSPKPGSKLKRGSNVTVFLS